jgi:hypothetical protein
MADGADTQRRLGGRQPSHERRRQPARAVTEARAIATVAIRAPGAVATVANADLAYALAHRAGATDRSPWVRSRRFLERLGEECDGHLDEANPENAPPPEHR